MGKHRTASELKAILSGTELGNIGAFLFPPFADDSTNAIYIVDNPIDIADNLAALAMFDQPPLQVELEVTIYEINEGDRGKLGLDWDVWKRFISGTLTTTSESTAFFYNDDIDIYNSILSLDAAAVTDFLNYTVQTGTTEVVTATKITMVNSEDVPGGLSGGARGSATGTPAVIESITSIPFTVITPDSGLINSTNTRNEYVDEKFEGIRVEILPFVGVESTTLRVYTTVNSLVGFSKDTDQPLISSRSVDSVANVVDGVPLVLGGLERTNNVKSVVGLPFLKDLPVAGYLFGKEVTDTTKSKVLISIKPRIVNAAVPPPATPPAG